MSKEDIELPFYYDLDGQPNNFLKIIGGCTEKNSYFFLRKLNLPKKNLIKMFLDDLSISFEYNKNEKLKKISIINIHHPIQYLKSIDNFTFKNKVDKAMKTLESLLNERKMVGVKTIMRKVPFFNSFGSTINYLDIEDTSDLIVSSYGHMFLIVWHDEKYFYYVEDFENIKINNFIPFKKNKSIGKIEKKDLFDAFNYYVVFQTFKPNLKTIGHLDKNFIIVIEKIIKNYYKGIVSSHKNKIFQGREAIKELINICDNKNINLNDDLLAFDKRIGKAFVSAQVVNRIDRAFFLSLTRLKLLKELFLINTSKFDKLIDILDVNLAAIINFQNVMRREFFLGNFSFNKKIKDYLLKMLQANDDFFNLFIKEKNKIIEFALEK